MYKKLKNPIPVIIDADIGRTAISITIGFFLFVLLAVFLFLSTFVHAKKSKYFGFCLDIIIHKLCFP